MKKIKLLFGSFFILLVLFGLSRNVLAADLDRILNYVITVDPRMNDGTLDITYEITWKVLDSTTEGPLSWVKIGTPNEYFDDATALTKNIKKIVKNGSYVRIDFKKEYEAGEQLTFKYSIHQMYVHSIFGSKCRYNFTPAWFTDAKVDNLKIRWNASDVESHDATNKEDNYLVWTSKDLAKGEKLTINVEYDELSFGNLKTYKKSDVYNSYTSGSAIMIYIGIIIIVTIISCFTGGGYGGYRGFYGGYHIGGCVRSSCACACARSCACACAGSGRAGCSKKDFYGTKLTKNKIEIVLIDSK